MERIILFLTLSIVVHLLLFFIQLPQSTTPKEPVKIDIVTRPEEPTAHIQKPPETEPIQEDENQPTPPKEIIPNTPQPSEDMPVSMLPQPNIDTEPQTPTPSITERQKPTPQIIPITPDETSANKGDNVEPAAAEAIIPKVYSPDAPPAPFSFSDFIKERGESAASQGPERTVEDIIQDVINASNLPEGEDQVNFSNMSARYDSYFYKFSRSLYAEWKYPPDAAKRGESGIVRIQFSILTDGTITNIKITESSGYPELDREVLRTLKTMQTVELPRTYNLNVLHVNGFFIYSLRGDYRLY